MSRQLVAALLVTFVSVCRAGDVEVATNLLQTHPVSKLLYGIFFEEINHAGDGGLYAELIQDRSFDALAITNGFTESKELVLEAKFNQTVDTGSASTVNVAVQYNTASGKDSKMGAMRNRAPLNYPEAWKPLSSTKVFLTKQDPLTPQNLVSLNITTTNEWGGITNGGYWGIPVKKDQTLHFSMFMKGDKDAQVHIKLQSKGGAKVYAEAVSEGVTDFWQLFSANLTATETDYDAELSLQLRDPGTIVVDSWSLFPLKNFIYGRDPYPFRADLLHTLKGLHPRVLRFPGGCYVEGGDWVRNRFPWKTNVGPNYNRTGHLNIQWGYWSTDGLGLFEYMLLAEELQAEPIYVVNNGISHQESIPPERLQPFIQETLEALEFITGSADTTWGSVRASMGRKDPWDLKFLGIGNEDCGKSYYVDNYNAFAKVLKSEYPNITLIADCDLGASAKTELYDWHTYDDSQTMFNRAHEFDSRKRGVDAPIFASEYAVTLDGGLGNLRGAVAEAAFMTGMERNSDIVLMSAYAPLFTRSEARSWSPDMIVYDSHRLYLTPSYYVQHLFSKFQGELYASTEVNAPENTKVAASTTCLDKHCNQIAIKVVNFDLGPHNIKLSLHGLTDHKIGPGAGAILYQITGEHPEDENSFANPENVKVVSDLLDLAWSRNGERSSVKLDVPAMSVNLLALRTDVYHSTLRRALEQSQEE